MSIVKRIFCTRIGPDLFGPDAVNGILNVTGVFTFVAGVLYLPNLSLTRGESVVCFLLLLTIALLCATLGQLFILNNRLQNVRKNRVNPAAESGHYGDP